MKQLLGLFMALLCSAAIYGQTTVSGTITDPDGFPLVGATVLAKGTTVGTVADFDGKYQLTVPETVVDLEFSFTGYETQTVTLSGQTVVDVVMTEGVALDEIVVTGYATTSKRQTTAAISTVSSEELTAVPSSNVEQQLQGRAAGVTVITNGQPGTGSKIRIRGFGSFGGNEPLYVVDGVPISNIEFLNPDDIEATSVLKDASSASIYGARAASGVVVIQTKRGAKTPSPLQVTYSGLVGFTDPGHGPSFLTPEQDAMKAWEALRNDGLSPGQEGWGHPQYGNGENPVLPDYLLVGGQSGVIGTVNLDEQAQSYNVDPRAGAIYQVIKANKQGTDWYDAITKTGVTNRHTLGLQGSTDQVRYYMGFSAQDIQGILLNNSANRYAVRANTEFNLGSRVRLGENLQFTYSQELGLTGGAGGEDVAREENSILNAFRLNPLVPVYDEFGGYAGTRAPGFGNPRNPVAERDAVADNQNFNTSAFGNFYVEVDPIENLTLKSSFGGNYYAYNGNSYGRWQYENAENNSSYSFSEYQGYGFDWTFTNTATYNRKFGAHSVNVLAGIEALSIGNGRSSGAGGLNPFSQTVDFISLSTVTPSGNPNSNYFVPSKFYSVFGQVNYNFNDRYYITGVLRRDGSSRFGADNRFGTFPAISAAWRVTAEPFMQNQTFFTDLKIRGGWGQMGNSNNVNATNRFNLYSQEVASGSYPIDGSNSVAQNGFYLSRIGTETAKWEASETSNIGFDATLLAGKVDVIVDLWRKQTDGLLVSLLLPNVNGPGAQAPTVNVGSMRNQGIDAQFIYRDRISDDFRFEVTVNGAVLKNEIIKFNDDVDFFDGFGTRIDGPVVRNIVGQSLSTYFGYRVLGLFDSQQEVDSAPDQADAAPGRFRFEDNNGRNDDGELTGMPDGKIDEADRTFLGSAVPDFTGGLNLKLMYKNFDLTGFFYSSVGNEIYNNSKWFTDFYGTFKGAAVSSRVLDSWTPSNTDTDVPIYESAGNFSTSNQSNSYYVEDGSYLRLQYLTLGYSLPDAAFNGVFSSLRLAVSATNVFTLTGYDGLDPAVGGAADSNFGIDIGNYPVTRGYNFQVTAKF